MPVEVKNIGAGISGGDDELAFLCQACHAVSELHFLVVASVGLRVVRILTFGAAFDDGGLRRVLSLGEAHVGIGADDLRSIVGLLLLKEPVGLCLLQDPDGCSFGVLLGQLADVVCLNKLHTLPSFGFHCLDLQTCLKFDFCLQLLNLSNCLLMIQLLELCFVVSLELKHLLVLRVLEL